MSAVEPEVAVKDWLLGDTTIAGLISTRMYPVKAPQQGVRPYIVYRRISGNPEHHMLGAAAIGSVRIQIDSLADSWLASHALADAVRMRLDGLQGASIAILPSGTFYLRSASLQDSRDDFFDPQLGTDDGTYVASQDFLVFYVLPIPTL